MSGFRPTPTYDDAPAAIEFLCRAFVSRRRRGVPGEDGAVRHSELTFGHSGPMVSSSDASRQGVRPRNLPGLHGGP